MEKQSNTVGAAKYSGSAAIYQPNESQLRRTLGLVILLLAVFLIGLASRAHAEVKQPASYQVIKGATVPATCYLAAAGTPGGQAY
jgi:hypothetical protein